MPNLRAFHHCCYHSWSIFMLKQLQVWLLQLAEVKKLKNPLAYPFHRVRSIPAIIQLTGKEGPCGVRATCYFHSASSAFPLSMSQKKVSCLKKTPVDLKSELTLTLMTHSHIFPIFSLAKKSSPWFAKFSRFSEFSVFGLEVGRDFPCG